MRRLVATLVLAVVGVGGVGKSLGDEHGKSQPVSTAASPRDASTGTPASQPQNGARGMRCIQLNGITLDSLDSLAKQGIRVERGAQTSGKGTALAVSSTHMPKAAASGKPPAQVVIRIKLFEVDQEKLRRLGFKFSQFPAFESVPEITAVQDHRTVVGNCADAEGLGLFDVLRKDGLARVLAEPTIMTADGRAACVVVGGQVLLWKAGPDGKPVEQPEQYGTSVNVVPQLTESGRVRLHMRCEHSELDPSRKVVVAGKQNPAICKMEVQTNLEMKSGETFVLAGPSRSDGNSSSKSLVLLVTPEVVETMTAMPGSDHAQRR